MFDPDNRDQPPRSLLALSGAAQPADPAPAGRSLLFRDETADAVQRHRSARSRREAKPSPLLGALSRRNGERAPPDDAPVGRESGSSSEGGLSPLGRLGALLRFSRWEKAAAAAAPDASGAGRQPAATQVRPAIAEAPVDMSAAGPGDDDYWRPLIDPVKIFQGIYRSRHVILATTLLGALAGVAIALNTPKKYESVAELLVDPRNLKIVDSDLVQSGLSAEATLAVVENQVRVITSGAVLEKVVDRLNLEADPEFNGQGGGGVGVRDLISGLRSIVSRGGGGNDEVRQRALAIENLAKSLDVERGGKTFVVSIGVTTQDAQKSALVANTVTQVFLEAYGGIQSGTAGRASDELTARLSQLQAEVEGAERKVEAFKTEHDLIDAQGRLISDDEMVRLNEQLAVARARTIELNARAASARDVDVDAVLTGDLPEQVASPVMAQLRSQYATLKQEVDRLAVRLGPRHPQRLDAEAQLAGAREGMQADLRRVVASIQVELKRAVQLEQDLAARLAQLKVRQSRVSEDLVTLREMEREATAKRTIYESFLLRARETGEQSGFNTANISIISEAQPPLQAEGPSRAMTTIASTVVGFLAGVGIGVARGAMDSLREGGARTPLRRAAPSPRAARRREENAGDEGERPAPRRALAPEREPPAASVSASAHPEPERPRQESRRAEHSSEESPMYPPYPYPPAAPGYPYPQPGYPAYAQAPQPPAWPGPAAPYWSDPHAAAWAQQQAMNQAWAAAHHQPAPHTAWGWQQHAAPAYPPAPPVYAPPAYAAPQTPYQQPYPQQPAPQHRPEPAPRERSAVDEIRDSLREFREAVRDLTDRRAGMREG